MSSRRSEVCRISIRRSPLLDACKYRSSIDELFQFIRVHVAELIKLVLNSVLRVPPVAGHDLVASPLTLDLLSRHPVPHISHLSFILQRAIGS